MMGLVYLNRILALAIAVLAVIAAVVWFWPQRSEQAGNKLDHDLHPNLTPFAQDEAAYPAIGRGALLALNYTPPQAQLPDLRGELVLHGVDGRPDADPDHPVVHIGLNGVEGVKAVEAGVRHYLRFERGRGNYSYSARNEPTALWFEVEVDADGEVTTHVGMVDRDQNPICEPASHAAFPLESSTRTRALHRAWSLGPHRVDNSLLARLHTRWYGMDRFLADHGGDDFLETREKQRLDFGTGEDLYSCFVSPGDFLVWKGDRWHNVRPGESSRGKPLLSLKALKEKLILFELWDEIGLSHMTLSVMRARDVWLPKQLKQTVRFVGVKTWSEYLVQLGEEHHSVSPREWMLLNEEGWRLLTDVDAIDAYVRGELRGELLVLEGLQREGGAQMLKGHLYNTSRTEVQPLEIPLTPIAMHASRPPSSRQTSAPMQQRADKERVEDNQLLSLPTVIRGMASDLGEAG